MPISSWCWRKDGSWSGARTGVCCPPAACAAGSTTCSSGADILSRFTIVRNAVKLDFPIVPAIRSVLQVCDEVVVNVGKSDDATRDVVAGIGDSRVRIVESEWDLSRGDMLALETQRAMESCHGSWGIYIQADEVLHEQGARILKEKVAEWNQDARVEGLLVNYLHFYGGVGPLAANPPRRCPARRFRPPPPGLLA